MRAGAASPSRLPIISAADLRPVVLGGLAGLLAWELFARLVAPFWIGFPLEPTALIEAAFGIGGAGALVIHALTGLLAFPLGWLIVARPLAALLGLPWLVAGLAYGAALWVFALFVVANLIAGLPAFLGFEAVAWASLVGHLLYGAALAAVAPRD